ncbi:MAG: HEAT repeat domain-containing protein [Elusimicrobia bacterium]|nr:HEAT repeat domain-containing protein [Elusimicrobiota bacterium]
MLNLSPFRDSFLLFLALTFSSALAWAGESWKPKVYLYETPEIEVSTSAVFRNVDPQIIQILIELLEEGNLGKTESPEETPSLKELITFVTPEGFELKNRYQRLGVALSESLGWEEIKHVRVVSEQNLKQRLTTIARWDHTPNVRSIALIALATIKDKNDLVFFQEALWSRDVGIRFATVEALKKWGFPESVPLLREVSARDESFLIRAYAQAALVSLNDLSGLEMLRLNLENKDWLVRAVSAKLLGEMGTAEDYDRLLDQINREQTGSPNPFVTAEVSIAALKLLPLKLEKEREERERKKMEKRKKKGLPIEPPAPRQDFVKKRSAFEMEPLVVTAPRLKVPPTEIVDSRINFQLLKMIQEKEDFGITEDLIGQSPAYGDLNKLVTPYGIRLKTRYNRIGFLLTEGLAGTKDFQLTNELVRIVRESQNPNVRSFALIALAYSQDPAHLSLFQEALRSQTAADRFAAVEALKIWRDPQAIPILVGVTKLDSSALIRIYAAQTIFRLGDPMGRDFLLRMLDDPDWVVRAMAMRYLGEMGGAEDYYKVLSYLAMQQHNMVRVEMASALLRLYAKKVEQSAIEGEKR